ncbi:MAG: disulfide bond formation protein DsbA [Caulobacter sp. 12-67-6]|nr:MAG: disulfide bond formation protein DsbA [Caulobacter sp. 12-67-6]
MTKPLKIDFVSDVSCPWCIVGLGGLETALERVGDLVEAEIHFQPFELNPNMPPEGQNIVEHIGEKYGATPEQSAANRKAIHERAASVGFTMKTSETSRIYNTYVLASGQYAQEVREAERAWHTAGISSVPAVIINDRYLISGGQPAEYFEKALRQIAAEA